MWSTFRTNFIFFFHSSLVVNNFLLSTSPQYLYLEVRSARAAGSTAPRPPLRLRRFPATTPPTTRSGTPGGPPRGVPAIAHCRWLTSISRHRPRWAWCIPSPNNSSSRSRNSRLFSPRRHLRLPRLILRIIHRSTTWACRVSLLFLVKIR